MNIVEIAKVIGAKYTDNTDADIQWLLTDSRSLSFPEETLFFALCTQRNNGHLYIQELYERNVRNFVVEKVPENAVTAMPDANFLVVENTLRALQQLVAAHRQKFQIPVIGITGSNGKTIVKEWLYQLLREEYNITRSPRSYNSQIGVPLSVWQINEQTELGIFEAGISLVNEMSYLQDIIQPTIGIFTNIGDAHQENFHTLKEKCSEKLKLFKNADVLVYCKDNQLIDIAAQQAKIKSFTWGKSDKADVQIITTHKAESVTRIEYKYAGKNGHYNIPFLDNASIENSQQCLAVMLYMNYDAEQIAVKMLQLESIEMRLDVKEGVRNCLVINDSYNSDLASLTIALDFLDQQATTKNLSKTIILSDIYQNGQPEDELYKSVADLLKSRRISQIVGIGSQITLYKEYFADIEAHFYSSTETYIASGAYRSLKNQVILLKGSRHFQFEAISKHLEMIAHETVLEVNLSALVNNLNYFRNKLNPTTKIMCMVKAFAYGSGSVEVARTLQHHHCDYLAVAVADEGAELRREGIRIPIVVMDPYPNAFNAIFDNNLEPEIYSFKLLDAFIAAADKHGITNYPVHIKIDSGMHRLGFELQDIPTLIERLTDQQSIVVRSIFSHLAGADESKFDNFTAQQIKTFDTCAEQIKAAMPYPIMKHILNSAGIERFPENQFDMVRLGIGHYGVSALPNTSLQNVCTLKTVILQIKTVKAGESVGYSRKAMLQHTEQIAVIPIGYADGFDRKLGNGVGEVIINGKRCKVVGNICMDLAMIDVTGIDCSEGDEVIIFGDDMTMTEIADKLGTISYEVLTSVSRRVKRVYFQE